MLMDCALIQEILVVDKVLAVIEKAKPKQIPIRMGVNAGSLPKHILDAHGGHPTADGMVETALEHGKNFRKTRLSSNEIIH